MTLGEIAQEFKTKEPNVWVQVPLSKANELVQLPSIGADTVVQAKDYTDEYDGCFDDYMERNFVEVERRMKTEEMTKHPTGAVRSSDADDVSYHLISPIGMRRLAQTCREGELKYSAYNWEKGFPITDILNHAIAHIYKFLEGDRSEDHLAHAAWNMFAAMHSEESWPELNVGTLRSEFGCPPTSGCYNLSPIVPPHVVKNYHDEALQRTTEEMEALHSDTQS